MRNLRSARGRPKATPPCPLSRVSARAVASASASLTFTGNPADIAQQKPLDEMIDGSERVAAAGVRSPVLATLTDRVLEAMLYAGRGDLQGAPCKAQSDWANVHHDLPDRVSPRTGVASQ